MYFLPEPAGASAADVVEVVETSADGVVEASEAAADDEPAADVLDVVELDEPSDEPHAVSARAHAAASAVDERVRFSTRFPPCR